MKLAGGMAALALVCATPSAFAQEPAPSEPPPVTEPAPAAASQPTPSVVDTKANPVFIAGASMALSGFIIFTVGGILTISNTVKAHSDCFIDRHYCDSDGKDAVSAARTWGWISTGALAVSAVGLVMAIIAPSKKKVEASIHGAVWEF